MKRFHMSFLIPIWLAFILMIITLLSPNGESVGYWMLSGFEISGVRGVPDYGVVSCWICIMLPIYCTIGFWLHQRNTCRYYFICRYLKYGKWWRRICLDIFLQIIIYYILWGIALVGYGERSLRNMIACISFLSVHTLLYGIIIGSIWELSQFLGSVLIVVGVEFVISIIGFYVLPETAKFVFQYCGMYRYVDGAANYIMIIVLEIMLIAIVILILPCIYKVIHH